MKSIDHSIQIPKPEIFSFSDCLHFLDRGYDDCLYSLGEAYVIKPLRINGNRELIRITENAEALEIRMLTGTPYQEVLEKIKKYVIEWFDLQRDLSPFYGRLQEREKFKSLAVRYYGLRLMGIPDLFEALCWCVLGQQINLSFAHRLKRNLVETYGTSINYDSTQYFYFPAPAVLADLEIEDLKKLQFSRQKAEYIIGIAKSFVSGELSKIRLSEYETCDQMLRRLMKIRGVGEWTANYVLMKSLKQMNCITYGDTGLHSAVSSMLGLKRKPTREEVHSLFEPFTGWESYLVIYLWRTLS